MNIIELAKKWGYWDDEIETVEMNDTGLEEFAAAIRADEREACAKVCEEWLHGQWHNQGVIAATMIRARGEK